VEGRESGFDAHEMRKRGAEVERSDGHHCDGSDVFQSGHTKQLNVDVKHSREVII
jgi:hypothetical protein